MMRTDAMARKGKVIKLRGPAQHFETGRIYMEKLAKAKGGLIESMPVGSLWQVSNIVEWLSGIVMVIGYCHIYDGPEALASADKTMGREFALKLLAGEKIEYFWFDDGGLQLESWKSYFVSCHEQT